METYAVIDLHMHTTASDGTDTPEELLKRVRAAGIDVFSVTDHDAVKGCRILRGIIKPEDPRFIPGVEFSCKDEEGKYHILGYGFDLDAEAINQVVERGHLLRMKKVVARLDYLQSKFGFTFLKDDVEHLLALDNPGKPHIGNLMVKYGYAKTKEEAMNCFINKARFRSEYIRPEEAIRGILDAGGIPVLAHPTYGSGEQLIMGEEMNRRIRRLTEYGLQGLEVFYSGFTATIRQELASFAERYDLYVTAGSDYHGRNKLIEPGDTGLNQITEWPSGLQRFLRDSIK